MDTQTLIIVILATLVAAFLLGIVVTRMTTRQAPSKVEQSAEEAAFAALERSIELLADKSRSQQVIAAESQRMALQDKLLAQAAQKLQAKVSAPAGS